MNERNRQDTLMEVFHNALSQAIPEETDELERAVSAISRINSCLQQELDSHGFLSLSQEEEVLDLVHWIYTHYDGSRLNPKIYDAMGMNPLLFQTYQQINEKRSQVEWKQQQEYIQSLPEDVVQNLSRILKDILALKATFSIHVQGQKNSFDLDYHYPEDEEWQEVFSTFFIAMTGRMLMEEEAFGMTGHAYISQGPDLIFGFQGQGRKLLPVPEEELARICQSQPEEFTFICL